ncbi:MAG: integrase [Pedobacter sp.]|nr:MAG: integrase [Pedobacter sp.]
MANIQFKLQKSNKDKKPISVRFKVGSKIDVTVNTGFTISQKDWTDNNLPKKNTDVNKSLHKALLKLISFLEDRYNETLSTSILIDKYWLQNQINNCFERVQKQDAGLIINHIQYIIDNANTRKIKGSNKIGLSTSRIKSYTTFKGLIQAYQKQIKREINFLDINKPFVDKFTTWLLNTQKYSVNYSGKQLDNLKTVCLDAKANEIPVNPYIEFIEGFSEQNEDRYIVTLTVEDLQKIKDVDLTNNALKNARNWILLGCELGQRASDLLSLTKENIRYKGNTLYVDLVQQKTGKSVTVGVAAPHVIQIIENDFPHKISTQKLNDYIKKVCKAAKVDEVTEGKKYDNKTNRKKLDFYPKHELVTTHSFRRSFATNYYKKVPTAVLINITGHSKESLFLDYINKREDKDANADLFMRFYEDIQKDKEPQLRIVKEAVNG